jgi:hypothetical protein
MFDFECEIYAYEKLTTINFADYIKNKKILICPCVKILQKPSIQYFQYVETLLELQELDEIIILDSNGDKFFHPVVYSFFPKIKTVSTTSQNYIKIMQKEKNKSQNINKLIKTWAFQHLIDNNKEVGFWEQPQENHWEHLLKNKRAMKELLNSKHKGERIIIANLFRSKSNHFWNVDNYNIMSHEGDEMGEQLVSRMGHKLWYFNLYNNKELEDTIIGNNKETIA